MLYNDSNSSYIQRYAYLLFGAVYCSALTQDTALWFKITD